MIGEELERRALVVLLAHEEQRCREGEQHDRQGYAVRLRRQPVTERTVADLVVVLRRDDQPLGRRPGQLAHDPVDRAERRVVAVVLAGQQHVQLVMQVVEPHRVVSPLVERPKVVVAHLADDEPLDAVAQLTQHVHGRLVVEDRVHGVE